MFFVAVALGVPQLPADLAERLALSRHLEGREVPLRMTRYARGLVVGVRHRPRPPLLRSTWKSTETVLPTVRSARVVRWSC